MKINGRVIYPQGPWGALSPVRNAQVRITDIDAPGRGNDLIYTGVTDSNGYFRGNASSEWQDKIKIGPAHVPDPSDILIMRVRIESNGKSLEIEPFINAPDGVEPVPLVMPSDWSPPDWMPVARQQRALVVVQRLVGTGSNDWQWLYQFLDATGTTLANQILGPVYHTIRNVTGNAATKAGFLTALNAAATMAGIRAVDVILNLHGSPEKLAFADGLVSMSQLQADIGRLNLRNQLRMLYSTACFGDSHSDNFVAAGFKSAIGAIGVNANSAVEYPTVLTLWGAGLPLQVALETGENPLTRTPSDTIATNVGFSGVNSDKRVRGNANLTIVSPA